MGITNIFIIILLCIGAIQGLVFGFILLRSKKHNKAANFFLAVLLFLLSYRLIIQVMRLFGVGYYDGWYYFMLDLSWVHGALLYFYARTQITNNFKLNRNDWIHFVPLLIQICFSLFVRLQNIYWDGTRESLTWLGYWGYVLWMNNATIYIVASSLIIFYAHYSEKMLKASNDLEQIGPVRIKWVTKILRAFKIYFAIVLVILLTDLIIYNIVTGNSYFYFERFYFYPFFIGLAVLTYWLGLEGFSRRNRQDPVKKKQLSNSEKNRLIEIAMLLEGSMAEKKLYRKQDISISLLAKELDVKSYLISKCLNEIIKKKFNDYINEFRVKEVQRLLKDSKNAKYTLLSLAMEAGFNSKSSFNRAVKKQLGITPNELKSSR